nr:Tok1 [Starmerella bombicola]
METADVEELDWLESQYVPQQAAALHLLLAISSPKGDNAFPEDTSYTIIFELLFELTSPIGLLGNLASICSIADRWRENSLTHKTIPDKWWVLFLNSLALALGCLANIVMYLHVKLWMARSITLTVTIACYIGSVVLYVSLLGACEYQYFGRNHVDVMRTSGYWEAACATSLYFLATVAMSLHMLYFRGRDLCTNISKRQHRLMSLCVVYMGWVAIGAASFEAKTMLDVSYVESVYYVVVSYLTLGYGDVVPTNDLGRALTIPFIYVGIILGGLVSIAVFQAILESARGKNLDAVIQRGRCELLKEWHASERSGILHRSDEESFQQMRALVKSSQLKNVVLHATLTLAWLVIFWLLGALIFMATEGWSYFIAFYMCAISLVGVGYGDYVPKSPGGRAIFIHWAMIALPTMSATVSSLTSLMQYVLVRKPKVLVSLYHHFRFLRQKEMPVELTDHLHKTRVVSPRPMPDLDTWHDFLEVAASPDGTSFSYEIWKRVIGALFDPIPLPLDYWISEDTPLRVPHLDERKFLSLVSLHIMQDISRKPPSSSSGSG